VTLSLADLPAPAFGIEPPEVGALALLFAAFGAPALPVEAPALVDVARLLTCWRVWARNPGSEHAAGALEDVARLVALGLGTTGTAVRLWVLGNLAALRLDGKRGRP
jgi:hypothetical protein